MQSDTRSGMQPDGFELLALGCFVRNCSPTLWRVGIFCLDSTLLKEVFQ